MRHFWRFGGCARVSFFLRGLVVTFFAVGVAADVCPRIFLFTTDFCYVRDWETDPGLMEDLYRTMYFPHCERFTDTE
jgi:hypothetical protein